MSERRTSSSTFNNNHDEIDLTNEPDILNIMDQDYGISQQNNGSIQQGLKNDEIDLTSPLIIQNPKKSRLNYHEEIDLTNDTESWSMTQNSEDSKDNIFFPRGFNTDFLIANKNYHGSIEISTIDIKEDIQKLAKFHNINGNLFLNLIF